jgi:hypothetical protein
MITTLRITSVLAAAAVLTGVLLKYFVLPADSSVGADPRIEEVLDSPGVTERFKQTEGARAKAAANQSSPLVQQAVAYARYLSPPQKKKPLPSRRTTAKGITTGPVTPKFQVYATTYFEGNPELSQALIDEPGKGRHWVRQSSMVGHLLIEQVKDGVVIVKSSDETFELEIEQSSKTASSQTRPPISKGASSSSSYRRSPPPPSKTVHSPAKASSSRTPTAKTPSRPPRVNNSALSSEKAKELERTLENLERSYRSGGKTVPGLTGEESAARVRKLLASFRSTAAKAENGNGQTTAGERLKDSTQDPNKTSPASKTDKIEATAPRPPAPTPK